MHNWAAHSQRKRKPIFNFQFSTFNSHEDFPTLCNNHRPLHTHAERTNLAEEKRAIRQDPRFAKQGNARTRYRLRTGSGLRRAAQEKENKRILTKTITIN